MRIGDLGARPIVPVAVHIRPWIEALARLGLAAKGIVYLLVGMIAARAALLHRGGPKNQAGALVEILHQPLGTALLTAIGVGLAAYVAWRLVQALLDPERLGTGGKALAVRAGRLITAIIYGGLALVAFRLASGEAARVTHPRELGKGLLAHTGGWLLLGGIGIGVIVYGIWELSRGVRGSFMRDLRGELLNRRSWRWALHLGQIGLVARGVVLALLGWFALRAAFDEEARGIQGLDGALRFIAGHAGTTSLAIVGIGLAAYGLFELIEARYRRIAPL